MADEQKGQSSLGGTLPSTGQSQERQGQSNAGGGTASLPDMRTSAPGRASNAGQDVQRVSDLGREELRGSRSPAGSIVTAIPDDPLGQADRVASAIKDLIRDNFRIRREPGNTLTPAEWKEMTNGLLYGIQHTLDIVGGHPVEARLAADIRLHINRDEVDEANAIVDAL